MELSKEKKKYLTLLAEKYPTKEHVSREIINLKAILNLPKGTEHFMSDIHGEYEAFYHILNNCSGVIREKVQMVFKDTLSTKGFMYFDLLSEREIKTFEKAGRH